MKIVINTIALCALTASFACSADVADDGSFSDPAGEDSAFESSESAGDESIGAGAVRGNVLDEITVESGSKITLEEGPNGGIVVIGDAAQADAEHFGQIFEGATSVEDLYSTLERAMPESVVSALERFDGAGQFADLPEPEQIEASVPGVVDEHAVLPKEAPRYVDWFRSSFCSGDHMDEYSVRDGWWRKNDWCYTERTNGFNLYTYNVRQGFAVVHMYRGSATLRYHWQTSGSWTLGSSYPISEGRYNWTRVTIPSQMNLRFELINASGDGFNYSIHTAKAGTRGMKGTTGTDYYHILCQCDDSWNWRNFILEQCIANPSDSFESNTRAGANLLCQQFANINNFNCSMQAYERRTVGETCSASSGQNINNCTDWPGLCSH